MPLKPLIVFALVARVSLAYGQSNIGELSTPIRSVAKEYDGHEYRPAVAAANLSAQRHETDSAWASLKPVLDYCDTKTSDPEHTFVSVADDNERDEAVRSHQGSTVIFVDRACPAAYKTAAFLAVEAKDAKRALTNLDRAESLSPYWADIYVEHGYLLRILGDFENSLRTYRHALSLAQRYPSSSDAKGVAFRGIGFVLTEQKDLDGAQEAYEEALKVDPSNDLARHELDYIAKLRLRGEPDFVMNNAKVIPFTKFLEEKPFDKDASLVRKVLLDWEDKSSDVVDRVCPGVLSPVPNEAGPYGPQLAAQFIFGSAAYQISNPGEKGKLMPQQLAGMQSMLRAYRSIVAEKPDARVPRLDELAQKDAEGTLLEVLEPLVAANCKSAK